MLIRPPGGALSLILAPIRPVLVAIGLLILVPIELIVGSVGIAALLLAASEILILTLFVHCHILQGGTTANRAPSRTAQLTAISTERGSCSAAATP
jgi:hypothetical protein